MNTTIAFVQSQGQGLRRAAAGIVTAAVPFLYNMPGAADLGYNGIWSLTINSTWGGIALDAALALTCLMGPFNAALCGALAVV